MAWADNAIGASALAGRTKKPKEKVEAMPRKTRKKKRVEMMDFNHRDWKDGFCPHHTERCPRCLQKIGKRVPADWLTK